MHEVEWMRVVACYRRALGHLESARAASEDAGEVIEVTMDGPHLAARAYDLAWPLRSRREPRA